MPALAGALLFAAVHWSTPEECPGPVEFEAALDRHLDPRLRSEDVEVDVRVRAVESGYQLDLALRIAERRERHRVVDHDCAALVEFTAVLVATAIDPLALGGWEGIDDSAPAIVVEAGRIEPTPRDSPPIQVPRSRARPAPVVVEPPEPDPEPAEPPALAIDLEPREPVGDRIEPVVAPRPIEGFAAVATGGVVGLFPDPGGSVELAGGLDRGALRFSGGLAGWFGGRFRESDDPTRGGNLSAVGPVLELCGVPRLRKVDFPLCASGRGGAEIGQGVGLMESSTRVRPWVAVGGDVGVRWRVGSRVALRLGIGVLASLVRPTWTTPNTSFTTPPVLGQLRLALEWIPRKKV
jgi:hypothetical protein